MFCSFIYKLFQFYFYSLSMYCIHFNWSPFILISSPLRVTPPSHSILLHLAPFHSISLQSYLIYFYCCKFVFFIQHVCHSISQHATQFHSDSIHSSQIYATLFQQLCHVSGVLKCILFNYTYVLIYLKKIPFVFLGAHVPYYNTLCKIKIIQLS